MLVRKSWVENIEPTLSFCKSMIYLFGKFTFNSYAFARGICWTICRIYCGSSSWTNGNIHIEGKKDISGVAPNKKLEGISLHQLSSWIQNNVPNVRSSIKKLIIFLCNGYDWLSLWWPQINVESYKSLPTG